MKEYNKEEVMKEVVSILDGITRDDSDDKEGGWWETSQGVEFGKRKQIELLALLEAAYEEMRRCKREHIPEKLLDYKTKEQYEVFSDRLDEKIEYLKDLKNQIPKAIKALKQI